MNILAIDYGQKRLGLAWVQEGLDVVLPYGVISFDTWQRDLLTLIETEGIHKVVVGNPLGMQGEENENTKRVQDFVSQLRTRTGLPVDLFDERFSSQEADAMGGEATRDEKSAMVILQSYLHQRT